MPSDLDKPALPPRKRDWKPGNVQIGLFMRTETGAVIEMVVHDAKADAQEHARRLLCGLSIDLAEANGFARCTCTYNMKAESAIERARRTPEPTCKVHGDGSVA